MSGDFEAQAIVLERAGGPETLGIATVRVPPPGPLELRIRQLGIAVNFHDIYVRSGLYRTLALPGIPGLEGVGAIEAIGSAVTGFAPGDIVGYLEPRYGAYASHRIIAADAAISIPAGIDPLLAAGSLLKGITAGVLVREAHPLRASQTALVHAAAGGVGHILAQWAASVGAYVIGTAGSAEKAALARDYGCREVIDYSREDFADRVAALTGGRGVDIVFDAVGAATFDGSLRSLAVRGHLLNYGQSSGPIPPFELSRLAPKSASVTRVGYSHFVPDAAARRGMAEAFFDRVASGEIRPRAPCTYPLAAAAEAHRALEDRALGPIVLVP